MKNLCVIPARGGSKRLPQKNIKPLLGRPLIYHTIDAALKSDIFDKIIFSSDDLDIINLVSGQYSDNEVEVSHRPSELAGDESKVIETISHYFYSRVFNTEELGGYNYDQIWNLPPVAPLRTFKDISMAYDLLTRDHDSVVSITQIDFPPSLSLLKTKEDLISSLDPSKPWENGDSRSQDHPTAYKPNGAIYGMWSESFSIYENFYTSATIGYEMPPNRSIDIDTSFDMEIVEIILKKNEKI